MKTIVSALLALSVLAGIAAAPASAADFDTKKFWEQHQSY
jgi:Ni/Co efflux regulator RcnB